MTRAPLIAALALSSALLHSGCPPREADVDPPLRKIKVAWSPYLAYAPLAIAKENGYFREEGLDVELLDMRSYDGIVALTQRKVDVVAAHLFVGLFNAISRDESLRIVADKGHVGGDCPAYSIVVRAELFEGEDFEVTRLEGLRFDVRPSTIGAFILSRLLEPAGLTIDDVALTDLPGATAIEAFRNGSLDAQVSSEPHLSVMVDAGVARIWKPVDDIIPGLQYSVLIYGPSFLEDDRDTGVRFMTAYLRGVRTYNEGKTNRNVEIISGFTRLDPVLTKRACWASIHGDGHINMEAVDAFIDWAHKSNALERPRDAIPYWDPYFIDSANRNLPARDSNKGN